MTEATEPTDGAELLARIRPRLKEEPVQICLRPDLLEAWEEANEELTNLKAAADAGGERLSGGGSKAVREQAERVVQVEEQIEEHSVWFRFRGLPKDEFQKVCSKHPPRKNDQLDQAFGYNREAVEGALVRKCLIDPVFDDESWAELMSVCDPSQWNALRTAVREANGSAGDLPKSRLASQILRKSDAS